MSDQSSDNGDDATLAGEYLLGLLSEDERRAVERRIAGDGAFAALVESWASRLQPLADGVPEIAPPARVWAAIDRRIGGHAKSSLWSSLAAWRVATLLAGAAAAILMVVVMRAPEPRFTAALQATSGAAGFAAEVDAAGSKVSIRLVGIAPGAQRVPELWIIPSDGRPRSLGVISDSAGTTLAIPAALSGFVGADSTLAVSIEPQGGSPTGLPTGPVVATARLQRI